MIETDETPQSQGHNSLNGQHALPEGWTWVRLGDHVTKVGSGLTPLGGQTSYVRSGVPLIRSQNVHMNRFAHAGLAYITPEQDEEMKGSRVASGDVLLNITGASIGRVCVVPQELCPANVNQHVSIIRGDGSLDPTFLSFYISTPSFQRFVLDTQAGATRQALTKALIEDFQIPCPSLPEQRRIAALLTEQMAAVERARAAVEAQLQAAKALPAAYLRAVFDSEEARNWPRQLLREIADTCSGTTPSRGNPEYYTGSIPWVKTGELRDDSIMDTEEHISERAIRETSLRLLPANTLLVAMYGQGQTRGRTGILRQPATTNQACFAILPNPHIFDSHYLQWWFRHSYSRLRQETEGRGGSQPNLNGDVLRNQLVPLPSITDQKLIATKLTEQVAAAKQAHAVLQAQLDAINALPAALLRRAFMGAV